MEKKKKEKSVFVLVLWMMLMLMLMMIIVGVGKADDEEASKNKFSEAATPTPTPTPTPNPPNSYWEEIRKLVNKACTYLFPPKIDFRAGKGVEDGGESVNGNAKEAITKSFQKTKEMVEDSAKAAAETFQKPPHSEL